MGFLDFFSGLFKGKKNEPIGHKEPVSTISAEELIKIKADLAKANTDRANATKNRAAIIKTNIESVLPLLKKWLSDDDDFYLKYCLGNKFYDAAATNIFIFLAKQSKPTPEKAAPMLAALRTAADEIEAEKNAVLPTINKEIAAAIIQNFVETYEISGRLQTASLQAASTYRQYGDYPCWTCQIQLQPPSSHKNRLATIVLSAKSGEVELME